ncbi:hypothetical protein [Acinetobacter baumannii]|uniref:hypothetical protein n=1 Tax=Acinetobacter baumannii TaxID=470 RepID=UPI003CFA56CE
MACYDCFFCTVYASGIQAASALRRGSMFDVMEQQRCYAAGQSALKQSYAAKSQQLLKW